MSAATEQGWRWRIQTPHGFIVPAFDDPDPAALATRYAKMTGTTWEALRAKGYRRFHWKRGAKAYPFHEEDVR